MPQALIAVISAALVKVGVAAATATIIATAVVAIGTIFVSGIFGGGSARSEKTERAIKSPTPSRGSSYGRRRLFGAQMLFDTASNGATVDVWAFHDGRANAILQPYLNDEPVIVTGGVVQQLPDGTYRDGAVKVGWTQGLPTETAFAAVIALMPDIWSTDHRGDGIVSGYLIKDAVASKRYLETYPQGDNVTLSLVGEWQLCFDPRNPAHDPADAETWSYTENAALHLLHYFMVRRGYDYATRLEPVISYWIAAADDCDEPMPLGSAITVAVGANAGASIVQLATVNGLAIGQTITFVESGQTRLIANITGAFVEVTEAFVSAVSTGSSVSRSGRSEPRYRGCVAYDADKLPGDIISELLACFDGWTAQDENGCYLVYSGRLYTPTVTIGPDEIVSYSHQSFVEQEDAVNELVVQYVSDLHKYATVECQPWRDEAEISARGRIVSDGFSPQVPSHTQARRLAKRAMARRNAPNRGRVTTTIAGRIVIGQRYINLHLEEAGEVQFSGAVEIVGAERDYDTGGVTFDWVSVPANLDAWNPATEDGEPAPVGNRVPVAPLDAPTVLTVTVDFTSGTARLQVSGNGPDRDDLTWFARHRVTGDPAWFEAEYADTAPGSPVALVVGPVPTDASVQVEIAYQIGDGRVSPWSATQTVSTSTSALAPASPSGVAATGGAGQAVITWSNPTSSNFAYARVYRASTTNFADAVQVGGNITGAPGTAGTYTDTGVAAGTRRYWVRAFNASDAGSAAAGPASATVT